VSGEYFVSDFFYLFVHEERLSNFRDCSIFSIKITSSGNSMTKKPQLPIHDGAKVSDAMDMFKAIIHRNGLSKHTIKDWGPDLVVPHLTDPEGWLATWMLKSDEMCIELLGTRIWDCVYIADKNSVEGVKPANVSDLENAEDMPGFDTYLQYGNAEEKGVPISVRFLICNAAFCNSMRVNNKEVSISPIQGFYNLDTPLKHGDLLPLPDEEKIRAQHWNAFLVRVNKSKVYELAKENQPSTTLD
jgi:hypothetical protein